jgi:hypothetical protein
VALWDFVWFLSQGLCPRTPIRNCLDLVHFERAAFKKTKVFGVPLLKKGNKGSLTTQDTKDPILLISQEN